MLYSTSGVRTTVELIVFAIQDNTYNTSFEGVISKVVNVSV